MNTDRLSQTCTGKSNKKNSSAPCIPPIHAYTTRQFPFWNEEFLSQQWFSAFFQLSAFSSFLFVFKLVGGQTVGLFLPRMISWREFFKGMVLCFLLCALCASSLCALCVKVFSCSSSSRAVICELSTVSFFLLSAFCFLLSAFCFLFSDLLISPFLRLLSHQVPVHPLQNQLPHLWQLHMLAVEQFNVAIVFLPILPVQRHQIISNLFHAFWRC